MEKIITDVLSVLSIILGVLVFGRDYTNNNQININK